MNSKKDRLCTFCQNRLDLNFEEEIKDINNEDRNNEDCGNENNEQIDYRIPIYNCINDNGYIFLLRERSNLRYEQKKVYQLHKRFQNVKDLNNKNNLQSLIVHVDFQEMVKDIHDLQINQFDLNNISNLSLNLDSFDYDTSIHFIQSIIPFQNLKHIKIQILEDFVIQDFLNQLSKLFSNKTNLNCLQIIVRKHDSYGGFWFYGFEMIFSDQGKIKELQLSTDSLELDVQHLQTIEKLTYKFGYGSKFPLNIVNEFLKKLINLKYLKIEQYYELSYYDEQEDQINFFQIISQLKQLKSIILNCYIYANIETKLILQSQSLEHLNISLGNKMIPIQCSNLQYLDINFNINNSYFNQQNLDYINLDIQLSKMNNLKFIKIRSQNYLSQQEYVGLKNIITFKLLKLKRFVKYDTEFGYHKKKLDQMQQILFQFENV